MEGFSLEKLTSDFLSQFAFKKSSPKLGLTPEKLSQPITIASKSKRKNDDPNDNSQMTQNTQKRVKKEKFPEEEKEVKITSNLKEKKRKPSSKSRETKDPENTFDVYEIKEEKDLDDVKKKRSKSKSKGKVKGRKKSRLRVKEANLDKDIGVERDPELSKLTEEDLKLPRFATDIYIRDKYKRKPNDIGYDPTTLYVDDDDLKKMHPFMRKFWEIKRDNYDKLIFIRTNKLIVCYYNDAFVCHRELGSNMHKGNCAYLSPHTINNSIRILLSKGYKVVYLLPSGKYRKQQKAKFEINQIMTAGTFTEPNLEDYTSKYCFFLVETDNKFGFTYLDATTHEFYMGEFKDTPSRLRLRSLLFKTKPVEIVYKQENLSGDTLSVLKTLYWKPQISVMNGKYLPELGNSILRIKSKFNQSTQKIPHLLNEILDISAGSKDEFSEEKQYMAPYYFQITSLAVSVEYLEFVHLDETIIPKGNFNFHDARKDSTFNMVIEGQTIYNLELLEVSYLSNKDGLSLFRYLDRTTTFMGKRMLQKWIMQPLCDKDRINERLDCVEELIQNSDLREQLKAMFKTIPDIERMIHHIYNFRPRKMINSIDFSIFLKPRLITTFQLLKLLGKIQEIPVIFENLVPQLTSKRLRKLLGFKKETKGKHTIIRSQKDEKEDGLFPFINDVLDELISSLRERKGLPVPNYGVDEKFDKLEADLKKIDDVLHIELERIKTALNCDQIKFAHAKQYYEIEIPISIAQDIDIPKRFIPTSKTKDFQRYHTKEIKQHVKQYESIEKQMELICVPFVTKLFRKFYNNSGKWHQLVSCISELDCLLSLASHNMEMKLWCRPKFVDPKDDDEQVFRLKGFVHPCLAVNDPDFIPNDFKLKHDKSIFLITGPNMGGKSTIMRSVCLATIMAQMGSFVPAKKFKLTPRDRIFTRIGAQDSLFEGKSTLYMELEESLSIVQESTSRSLVVIDELGRGTSTFDGVSLAYSILKHISEKINCLTLFATHFHSLVEEFKLYDNVICYHMQCEIVGENNINLLYKFKSGVAPHSFGLNVARLAGLPQETINLAQRKSTLMIKEKEVIKKMEELNLNFNTIIQSLLEIENNEDEDEDEEEIEEILPILNEAAAMDLDDLNFISYSSQVNIKY